MKVRPAILTFWLVLCASTGASAAPPFFNAWQTFGVADGLPSEKVFCILATETDVWAGTDHGLARYRDGRWEAITEADGLVHDAVMCLAEDPDTGDLWIGTMGGLNRYSAGRFESFTQLDSGLANDVVYGLTVHRGEVWIATAAGASRYQIAPDRWSIFDETNAPMHEIWCYSAAHSDDRIYLGVWGSGLLEYELDREHWKHYRDPDGEMEIDLFRNDGLVHDVVASVTCDDRRRVWIGTYFGLSSYDGRNWVNFMDHDSPLLSNFINYVYARGDLCWIGTDTGLNATDREQWWSYQRDPETGQGIVIHQAAGGTPLQFTTPTAMGHNYILGIAFSGETIWLATEQGVSRGSIEPAETARKEPDNPGEIPPNTPARTTNEGPANDSRTSNTHQGAKE